MEQVNITSAKYVVDVVTSENMAIRVITSDGGMNVPLDPANRHYAEIMRQVEAGELTIQDADS